MENLQVMEKDMGSYTLLEVEGSVNSHTYSDFQDKLYDLINKRTVCVDMSRVSNLSSAGLGVLMSAMESGEEKGFMLYILKPSEIVKMSIESTGFADIFNMIGSADEIK